MRHNFLTTVRRVAVLAGLALTAACSSDATAPVPAASKVATQGAAQAVDLAGTIDKLQQYFATVVLERAVPLEKSITVSATLGKDGGKLEIPQAGFELVVPKGAVTRKTTFTVTALAGKAIAYEFGPHGMTFKQPLTFRQNSMHTVGWWNATSGGYFKSSTQVDTKNSKAQVDEALPLTWDGSWMTMQLHHFSGYLVSCA